MIDAELEQIIAPMHDEIAELKRTLQDDIGAGIRRP